MLIYDSAHWLTFLAAAVVLNLSPGPDIAFILGQTVKAGRRAGTAAMFGIWTGAFGHVMFAALGLSAVVAASATGFTIIKWIGVAYLIWLGIQSLRSNGGSFLRGEHLESSSSWAIFRQGVLIDLLNPKVAIFFLAFLPQFVVQGAGPVWIQLMLHGALIILVGAVVEIALVFVGDRLTVRLRSSRKLALWLDRTMGTLFIGLGLRLATTER